MLLIDLDPQGHLTAHFGMDHVAVGAGIYEVLTQDLPLESAMHPVAPNITIIPAQIDLAAAEMELVSVVGREVILRDLFESQDWPYDMVMIDCPPSLGVLTLNALAASTHVVIPLQPHFLALQGVGKLLETVSLVSKRINPKLKVAGMVMCMYEAGTRLAGEVGEDLAGFITAARGTKVPWSEAKIFDSKIRRNVKLAEAPSYGQSIFGYAPRCNGAEDYLNLGDELIKHLAMMAGGAVDTDAVAKTTIEVPKVEPAAKTAAVPAPTAEAPKAQPVVAAPKVSPAPAAKSLATVSKSTASATAIPTVVKDPSTTVSAAPQVAAAAPRVVEAAPVVPATVREASESKPVATPVALAAPVEKVTPSATPTPPKRRPPTRKAPEAVPVPQAVAIE